MKYLNVCYTRLIWGLGELRTAPRLGEALSSFITSQSQILLYHSFLDFILDHSEQAETKRINHYLARLEATVPYLPSSLRYFVSDGFYSERTEFISKFVNDFRPLLTFAKLTEFQVKQIEQYLSQTQLTQKEIASQFNVSKSTVKDIESGRRWGRIPDVDVHSYANQRAA